eukprot:TRINITY_DN10277_c0_g1_i1.p1 TRINITY_DN10277_c0_g1~~TRINITY_DN10277_c0_g1_i1.p1  ORF type:complete len:890 (+),score=136.60 TRINITY_DN10277_c0_g1_i1:47-2716(+)
MPSHEPSDTDALVVRPDTEHIGEFSSITEALMVASEGAVISVHPGTYYENINIHLRSVTIKKVGFGDEPVVIKPLRINHPVLSCDAIGCKVYSITFESAQHTISGGQEVSSLDSGLLSLSLVMIRQVHVSFIGCKLRACRGTGIIAVGKDASIFAENCDFEGHGSGNVGIYLESSLVNIKNSNISGFRIGVRAANGASIGISNSRISQTTAYAITLISSQKGTIESTTISKNLGVGIHVDRTDLIISRSTFDANQDGGVCIYGPCQFSLHDSTMRHSGQDNLIVDQCQDFNITNTIISDCAITGLWVRNCRGGTFRTSSIRRSMADGIVVQNSKGVTVEKSAIERCNNLGIQIFDDSSCSITDNELLFNQSFPISIRSGSSATIQGNTVKSDSIYAKDSAVRVFSCANTGSVSSARNSLVIGKGTPQTLPLEIDEVEVKAKPSIDFQKRLTNSIDLSNAPPQSPRPSPIAKKTGAEKTRPKLRRANTPPPRKEIVNAMLAKDSIKFSEVEAPHVPIVVSTKKVELVSCLKKKQGAQGLTKNLRFSRELECISTENEISKIQDPDPDFDSHEQDRENRSRMRSLYKETRDQPQTSVPLRSPPPPARAHQLTGLDNDLPEEFHTHFAAVDTQRNSIPTNHVATPMSPRSGALSHIPVTTRSEPLSDGIMGVGKNIYGRRSSLSADVGLHPPRDSTETVQDESMISLERRSSKTANQISSSTGARRRSSFLFASLEKPVASFETSTTLARIQSVKPPAETTQTRPLPEPPKPKPLVGKSAANVFFTADDGSGSNSKKGAEKERDDEHEARPRSISKRIMGSLGLISRDKQKDSDKSQRDEADDGAPLAPARGRRAVAIGLSDSRMNVLQPLGAIVDTDQDTVTSTSDSLQSN